MVLPISRFWGKIALFLACLGVYWGGFHPNWVENYYGQAIYPHWSRLLRSIGGIWGFSLGDWLYLILLGGTCVQLVRWVKYGKRQGWRKALPRAFRGLFYGTMLVYLVFSLFWGLNYQRPGLKAHWHLQPSAYQKEDIRRLTLRLFDSTQKYRRLLGDKGVWSPAPDSLLPWTQTAYGAMAAKGLTPPLGPISLKPSLFSSLGDWVGYTGYFNPITGEGQYRDDLPFLLQPFVALHETAHQLGYAPEDEASWVAYTAALQHPSYRVRYAAHFELLGYALAEEYLLYGQESSFGVFEQIIQENKTLIDKGVWADRKRVRDFFQSRQNKVSPVMHSVYEQYLKLNRQEKGLRSYNAVLSWALATQN